MVIEMVTNPSKNRVGKVFICCKVIKALTEQVRIIYTVHLNHILLHIILTFYSFDILLNLLLCLYLSVSLWQQAVIFNYH